MIPSDTLCPQVSCCRTIRLVLYPVSDCASFRCRISCD